MHSSRRKLELLLLVIFTALLAGCDLAPSALPTPVSPTHTSTATEPATLAPTATTSRPTVVSTPTLSPVPLSEREFIPILAYHHIRDWVGSDGEEDRAYIVPPAKFEATLKYLKEKGYQGVTAPQIYEYFANGKPLPEKPVMLSFDDNDSTQYTKGVPLLKKYGFNATFFIMTVTIDKENYMTTDQLMELNTDGFDIQPHTWDHHMVTQYETEEDWQQQIVEPKKTLEELLGRPTPFFAYPFGIYDAASAEKLKEYGYKAAFRLRDVLDDEADPLFAIKRYIANPYFTDEQFEQVLVGNW